LWASRMDWFLGVNLGIYLVWNLARLWLSDWNPWLEGEESAYWPRYENCLSQITSV
jgi:hypothetical protein